MRERRILTSLLCLLLGVLFTISIFGTAPNYWRAKRFSAAVAQHLPLGSSKAQVLPFLTNEKIEHSYVERDFELGSAVKEGLQPSQPGGVAFSIVRRTARGLLTRGDTRFVFFFDKAEKLIKVSEKLYIGL